MYTPTNADMNAVDRTVAVVAFATVPTGSRSALAALSTANGTRWMER